MGAIWQGSGRKPKNSGEDMGPLRVVFVRALVPHRWIRLYFREHGGQARSAVGDAVAAKLNLVTKALEIIRARLEAI